MIERNIRYVELDEHGAVFHSAHASWEGGPTEEEAWATLVQDAAHKKHTLIRLEHSRYAVSPDPSKIEYDGRGGIRAKAQYPDAMRDVKVMRRA